MDKVLKDLFDYQRFEKNSSLEAVIDKVELRHNYELSDDMLEFAAGGVKKNDDAGLDDVFGEDLGKDGE